MKFPWVTSEIEVYLREKFIPASVVAGEDSLLGFTVGHVENQATILNAWVERRVNRELHYFIVPGVPAVVDDPPLNNKKSRINMQAAIIASWYRWRPNGTSGGLAPSGVAAINPTALISISIGERIG